MPKTDNGSLTIVQGDITQFEADAIVNAAGEDLVMGGGVAGAILRRGGQAIQDECDGIGHVPTGTAVITGAGRLKAKYVIHAVGPINGTGNEDEKLKSAVMAALEIAKERKIESIAFPAISAGIFGFPKDRCARIMIDAILGHLEEGGLPARVIIVLYDRDTFELFEREHDSQTRRRGAGP